MIIMITGCCQAMLLRRGLNFPVSQKLTFIKTICYEKTFCLFSCHYISFLSALFTKSKDSACYCWKICLVDGHKMHYQVAGVGSPTVVFEGGWNPVFTEVAKFARTVRYDRMGLGASDTTTTPRSFKQK